MITQGKHKCCVGTYGKQSENQSVAWEPIENIRETQVLRRNQWKTQGELRFCFGTYGQRNENICFVLEPIANGKKTQVLHGNLWKTQKKTTSVLNGAN